MLTALSIRDLVLIESLDLDFGAGLSVLTGETGAGKSILLDALGLALGTRADSGLVRAGRPQASVSVSFDVPADHPALALIAENGLDQEAGEALIIRRLVRADGGSRAYINDQSVSAGLLRDLGSSLVEIHGQHDDRGLLNPRGHRGLLDLFGGIDTASTAAAWEELARAEQALEQARSRLAGEQSDREWLIHAVDELRRTDPQAGEEQILADRRSAMQAGARLGEELAAIEGLLQGSEGGFARLRLAARRLDRIAGEHDSLESTLEALDRAIIEASEAERALDHARDSLAFDPARLDEAETRLFELRALSRKHQVETDALPALLERLKARLTALDSGEEGLSELERTVESMRRDYDRAASALTEARRKAAERLDSAVAAELGPLKLEQAKFQTEIKGSEASALGRDRVEFLVSTNAGAPFAPLIRIASGGELSRFILALKVALHEQGAARTIIFDEVDRGVGGAVASAVGERLHRLAATGQVLVVTHSPQVAARGATHWLIEKNHDGAVTRTSVRALDPELRREEIARMLSGAKVTEEARAQARRLLEAA